MTLRVAVLCSGRGTLLAALRRAIDEGRLPASIDLVVVNHSDAPALTEAAGLNVAVIPQSDYGSRQLWDTVLTEAVVRASPHVVVLAGFDRLVGAPLLEAFPDAVINVHPSLLPAFPGQFAVRKALRYGALVTGASVHLVDSGMDSGPLIAQAAVPVYLSDDEATLWRRIREVEQPMLVEVLLAFAYDAVRVLRLPGERPRVLSPFSAPPTSTRSG
jgi:phosphoribosylglycinamide formyltransferase 1